ncbi:MAG: response regulator [Catenulispora sp.]|nr:response regulator [Catenulispora sp.]
MKAPTRALIVEDHDTWVLILERAARRAGASEVIACADLQAVKEALRSARFDVAILDVGLDPDDQLNSDGIRVLELIREMDGGGTRCVLVTGWQGGDRMDLQAKAQRDHGVDWAYMKENYEAHTVIAKLSELLDQAGTRRLSQTTPMANLGASVEPWLFEGDLTAALSPKGGVQTLYSLVSRLLSSAIPVVAMTPAKPMAPGPGGVWVGLYWSRALAAALAVGLAPAAEWPDDADIPADLARLLPAGIVPELIESKQERNVKGCLWELPGVSRDMFP